MSGAALRACLLSLLFAGAPAHAGAQDLESELRELRDYTPYVRPASGTPAEIELGRRLFFDPRLSSAGTMSCAACHDPERAWADGRAVALGAGGKTLPRNTPSLSTARYYRRLFWDGRAETLEQAALAAIQNPREMDQDADQLSRKLAQIPAYAAEFAAVYGPAGLTPAHTAKAIAAFVSTLQSPEDSPFDRYLKNRTGLTPAAERGYRIFAGKGACKTCHNSRDFTSETFRVIGLKRADPADLGLYRVEPGPGKAGAFRTPSLRNASLTAPYMHDGSLATLADVVEFYDRGGDEPQGRDPAIRPLKLTPEEKKDLLAFLNSLTGSVIRVERPELPAPGFAPPSAPAPAEGGDRYDSRLAAAELDRALSAAALSASGWRRLSSLDFPSPAETGMVSRAASRSYCLASPFTLARVEMRERERQQACAALVAGDEGGCEALGGSASNRVNCRKIYRDLRLARAVIGRRADAADTCRENEARGFGRVGADGDRFCSELAAGGDPRRSCRDLARAAADRGLSVGDCLDAWGLYSGEGDCSHYREIEYQRPVCEAAKAFKRSAGDPGRCGGDFLCAALAGDAGACARFLAGRLETLCRPVEPEAPDRPDAPPSVERAAAEISRALAEFPVPPTGGDAREAAERLDATMRRRRPLDGPAARLDVAGLRRARAEELLVRARALIGVLPAGLEKEAGAERLRGIEAVLGEVATPPSRTAPAR